MAKTQTLGTKLYIGVGETPTWSAVGNLTSLTVPGPTKPEIDTTDFDSVAAESLPGLPDYGSFEFSGNYNEGNTGQAAVFTDANDPEAPVRQWRIDFTRQDVQFSFAGFVTSFRPSATDVNGIYTFDGAVRVTGTVTKTTPIPAP